MDRKSIIALVVCFALLLVLQNVLRRIYPPVPRPVATNTLATATNNLGSNVPPVMATATNAGANAEAAAVPGVTNAPAAVPAEEETFTLDTPDAAYTFTSVGGGVKTVALKKYPESIRRGGSISNGVVILNERGPKPIFSMEAGPALADNIFKLTRTPTNTVVAEKVMPSGLRVVKLFEPGSNYALLAHVWLENTSAQPLLLPPQKMAVGSAAPGPQEQPQYSGVFWFNGVKAEHVQSGWFDNRVLGCFMSRPRAEYDSGNNTVDWAAVHNQFFALGVIPATNALATSFTATRSPLPPVAGKKQSGDVFHGEVHYPAVTIAPKQFVDRQFIIYAGPKQEKTLTHFRRHLDEVMDFGMFSLISKLFLRAMNSLHGIMPYGVAIIVITVIIKLIFWPLTQASTRSMKRMQALQPEIKKLQEKYKDDPAKQQKKMMELWREHKVNPMSGCWPMLIQLPIFFALFRMIPNAIELRGTPFLWIQDLSRPDTILYIPGLDFPFNPLPLIMGVTMLWQARLTPPSPGMDPAQQKMMKYMPLMFLFFLYAQPSGLTLYWTVQNLLTIAQTKLTKAKEEKAAAAPAPLVPRKK